MTERGQVGLQFVWGGRQQQGEHDALATILAGCLYDAPGGLWAVDGYLAGYRATEPDGAGGPIAGCLPIELIAPERFGVAAFRAGTFGVDVDFR